MKTYLIVILSLYMTYYTGSLVRIAWKDGNKFAAVILGLLTAFFPLLAYMLEWR